MDYVTRQPPMVLFNEEDSKRKFGLYKKTHEKLETTRTEDEVRPTRSKITVSELRSSLGRVVFAGLHICSCPQLS